MICYLRQKLGAKPCSTPMAPNVQLIKERELFQDLERYKILVRKLNYLIVTRLSITYSVSILTLYLSSLIVSHWVAIEYILCYS